MLAPKGAGAVGLAGDQAHDVKHHGGTDQAVYAYAREDLDSWQEQLGRRLDNGSSFGENLTTVGVDVNGALIGERWRIGTDVLLEVTCPRIPCATFQGWLGEPGWLKRFIEARQPGAYLRVINEGSIRAGDNIDVVFRPKHDVTVALTFRAFTTEPELLPRLAVAEPLPDEAKALLRNRTLRRRSSGPRELPGALAGPAVDPLLNGVRDVSRRYRRCMVHAEQVAARLLALLREEALRAVLSSG